MIEKYDSKMRIKGEAWMKLGKATKKQILEKPDRHVKNLIVDICSNLLAQWALINVDNSVVASISDTTKHIPGILTLAVGTGGPGWNTQSPPVETSDLTLLFSEIARNTFASVNYVDSSGNDIATPISANVDITTSQINVGVNILSGALVTVTGTVLPVPLQANYTYFAINIDYTHIKLASSYANAIAGTFIPITTLGTNVQVVITTNVIDLLTTFSNSQAVGPLVEMGLFGGVGALNPNGGIRVNARHFKVVQKPNNKPFNVLYRLTF